MLLPCNQRCLPGGCGVCCCAAASRSMRTRQCCSSAGPGGRADPCGPCAGRRCRLGPGAWAAGVRELRRAVVPVGSHIAVTEPVPERLAELGWTGGELLGTHGCWCTARRLTRDGRIAFGRGGGAIGPAGRVLRCTSSTPGPCGGGRWVPLVVPATGRCTADALVGWCGRSGAGAPAVCQDAG